MTNDNRELLTRIQMFLSDMHVMPMAWIVTESTRLHTIIGQVLAEPPPPPENPMTTPDKYPGAVGKLAEFVATQQKQASEVPDLKPCPFCACEMSIVTEEGRWLQYKGKHKASCPLDGASLMGWSANKEIHREWMTLEWNTRRDPKE